MSGTSDISGHERFGSLLEDFGPALRRLCSAYARDLADAQDLFQEIALALWRALPGFRGDASERTWVYRVAHNVAVTQSVRLGRKRSYEIPTIDLPQVGTEEDLRHAHLLDAVRRLEAVDRELVLLYLEGLIAREIGEVLGISETNAAVRLTRVRQKLTLLLTGTREVRR